MEALLRQPLNIQQRLRQIGLVAAYPVASGGAVNLRPSLFAGPGPYALTNNNGVTRNTGPSVNIPDSGQFVAGSTQYLNAGAQSAFSFAGPSGRMTITCWAIFSAKVAGDEVIISKYQTTGNQREWLLGFSGTGSGDRLRFIVSANGTATTNVNADALGSPSTSTWYFIVAQVTGNEIRIKVNNGAWNSAAFVGGLFAGSANMKIGIADFGGPWSGFISDVTIHRRVLTDAEINWRYNNGLGRPLLPLV